MKRLTTEEPMKRGSMIEMINNIAKIEREEERNGEIWIEDLFGKRKWKEEIKEIGKMIGVELGEGIEFDARAFEGVHQDPTKSKLGMLTLMYMLGVGCANLRERLKKYEDGINWEMEAKKHAAEAGEMKIAIAEKLEEVRTRRRELKRDIEKEKDEWIKLVLKHKEGELEKQEIWIEKMLQRKR